MAKLGNENFGQAEINFVDYNNGYVSYSLRLLYGGKPIFNPEILAEDPFHFDEYDNDYLIPFLERLLAEDVNDTFNSLEPEVRIDAFFSPKLGMTEAEQLEGAWLSDKFKDQLKQVDADRSDAGGKLPDDSFDFIFRVNENKFKPWRDRENGTYGSYVPAMYINVYRKDLQCFLDSLKEEYNEWEKRNEEQIKHYGSNYKSHFPK